MPTGKTIRCFLLLLLLVAMGYALYWAVRHPPSAATHQDAHAPAAQSPPGDSHAEHQSHLFAGEPRNVDPARAIRVVDHTYFVVGYCEERGNPRWVAYRLGQAADLTTYPRPGRFRPYRNGGYSVTHDAYTHSGYSRGHMAPRMAVSSRHGRDGNDSTFVMDNVVPQTQRFNAQQWGRLEAWIAGQKSRDRFTPGWADVHGPVWVVVGPVFDEDRRRLPGTFVEIPDKFFCIVVRLNKGLDDPEALAFLIEHDDDAPAFEERLTTIDEIESATHLDLFWVLEDGLEERFERRRAEGVWQLTP